MCAWMCWMLLSFDWIITMSTCLNEFQGVNIKNWLILCWGGLSSSTVDLNDLNIIRSTRQAIVDSNSSWKLIIRKYISENPINHSIPCRKYTPMQKPKQREFIILMACAPNIYIYGMLFTYLRIQITFSAAIRKAGIKNGDQKGERRVKTALKHQRSDVAGSILTTNQPFLLARIRAVQH